jgi:Pyridoxamine 5'-phosphate oxidase
MTPTVELLDLPKEYGRASRKLAWAAVRAELERATQYWLATRRPDGRAHVVPLDGVWLDDVWYYGGSEQAVHYRNVLADPGVVMHLPDPMKAVIVEGDARLAHPRPELARRLAEAANAKYGYGQDPVGYQGALGLYPRTVRAWTAFPTDATRFRFG